MALKVKTIKGRGYWYNDVSYRENGKPKTKSTYLGPVNPKRKRLTVGDVLGQLLKGGVSIGAAAVAGQLGPPGGKTYKSRNRPPDPRSITRPTVEEVWALSRKAGMKHAPVPFDEEMMQFRVRMHEITQQQRARLATAPAPVASPASPQAPAPDAPAQPSSPGQVSSPSASSAPASSDSSD